MINRSCWSQIMDFKIKSVDKPTRWRCGALIALKKGMASKETKNGCCAKMSSVVGGRTVRSRKRKELWKTKLACFSSNRHFFRLRVNSSHTAMIAGRQKRHRQKITQLYGCHMCVLVRRLRPVGYHQQCRTSFCSRNNLRDFREIQALSIAGETFKEISTCLCPSFFCWWGQAPKPPASLRSKWG